MQISWDRGFGRFEPKGHFEGDLLCAVWKSNLRSKLNFCNLFEGKFYFGGFGQVCIPLGEVPGLGTTVAKGAVGAIDAAFFVRGEGELVRFEGLDVFDQVGEVGAVGVILGGRVWEMIGLGGVFGEPVDHFNLFGLKGRAAVPVRSCFNQQVTVNARLEAVEHGIAFGVFGVGMGGFPVYDDRAARFNGQEVVLCQEAYSREGRGQGCFGQAFGGEVGWRVGQVVVPPTRQIGIGNQAGEALDRQTKLVLLSKLVEARAQLHKPFMDKGGFGFEGRPGETIQVAELKPAFAVGEILEGGLGEGEFWRYEHDGVLERGSILTDLISPCKEFTLQISNWSKVS